MNNRLLLLVFFLVGNAAATGQALSKEKSKELSISVGTAYYLGEINPSKHFGT